MLYRVSLISCILVLITCATSYGALAQSSEPPRRPKRMENPDEFYQAPASMHGKTVVLPIGYTFQGRINQTISSEHSHPGQRFNIVVSAPVLANGSEVIIPVGSAVLGEVVEAVPAASVPRKRAEDKRLIRGKLRVQFSGLRMPDGNTYPLVASIAGEVENERYSYLNRSKQPLGTGVAYVGSAAGFAAVNPNGRTNDFRNNFASGGRPAVMNRKDFLRDQVMGFGDEDMSLKDYNSIRSLVLKKRDYYIYSGSPITVRIAAPFKIGVSTPSLGVPVGSLDVPPGENLPPPSSKVVRPGRTSGDVSPSNMRNSLPSSPSPEPALPTGGRADDSF